MSNLVVFLNRTGWQEKMAGRQEKKGRAGHPSKLVN